MLHPASPHFINKETVMHATRKLWTWLAVICVLSFAALGWVGREIYLEAPPIPLQVRTAAGETLFTKDHVQHGQQAWLSAGGQQLGTVWGHGSYLAPDWSADWLHREALALQDLFAERDLQRPYAQLNVGERAAIDAQVKQELRANTYDAKADAIVLSPIRAEAVRRTARHFDGLFGDAKALDALREQYAMTPNALPVALDRKSLTGFFFWTSCRPVLHQQLAA
jgi:nitric oxide reductase subunit B